VAEELDVLTACAMKAAPTAAAVSGKPYDLVSPADIAAYGQTQTTPNIAVMPGVPLLTALQTAHDRGDALVGFIADKHDAPSQQYVNDKRRHWLLSRDPLTITFTQSGTNVTLAGTLTPGNVLGLQFTDALSVGLAVQSTDATLLAYAQRVAAIATGIGVATAATLNGNGSVTLACARVPQVRSGATATYARVVQRRRKEISAAVWATTWHARAQIARSMESVLRVGDLLPMPDLSSAKVVDFAGTNDFDEDSPDGFYVRRIRWTLEWTMTETYTATPVVASTTSLSTLGPTATRSASSPLLASML
jgi:hypothetical protein